MKAGTPNQEPAIFVSITQPVGCQYLVAVWVELENEIRLVEVTYVGTHEKAPY